MQASSVPLATRQRIVSASASNQIFATSSQSSGYLSSTSSWASTDAFSSLGNDRPEPPLAWAGVRHQVEHEEKGVDNAVSNATASEWNAPDLADHQLRPRTMQSSSLAHLLVSIPRDGIEGGGTLRLDLATRQGSDRKHLEGYEA